MKTGTARRLILLCLHSVAVPSVLSDVLDRRVPGPSCSKATNPGLNFHPGFLFCCSKVFCLFYLGHPSHHTVDQEN